MKLNCFDRLSLLGILPQEGNLVTLKIVRDLQGKLSFSEEDYKEYGIVEKPMSIEWNDKGKEQIEIEVGEKATDIIKKAFNDLEESGKLSMKLLPLYERIVLGESDGTTT